MRKRDGMQSSKVCSVVAVLDELACLEEGWTGAACMCLGLSEL